MPKLLLLANRAVVRDYQLTPGTLRIGRKADNDIVLDDSSVSGHHADVITRASEFLDEALEVTLRDNNSTNGTRVNGIKITDQLLKHPDLIKIGVFELRYSDEAVELAGQTRLLIEDE
jgi:pSer/pThr/pTyr-binding forkhead associated (FHA) protein